MSRFLPYRRRLKIVLIFFMVGFCAILFRLAQLQIVEADFYRGKAVALRLKRSLLDAPRGSILDRTGEILAYDQPSFDICVHFKKMAFLDKTTGKYVLKPGPWMESISRLSGVPMSEVARKARAIIDSVQRTKEKVLRAYRLRHKREPPKSFRIPEELSLHPILKNVDFDTMAWAEVASENFPDITVQTVQRRTYPNNDLAAHILGFTGLVNKQELEKYGVVYDGSPAKRFLPGDRIGRMGIEKTYNRALRGERGELIAEVDSAGRRRKIVFEKLPKPGHDVFLTIEANLQRAAEEALGKQVGAFVVMNPENGEILAMATYPRFDPNTLSRDYARLIKNPLHPLLNRATQGLLPCGSTFKVVTLTAGLESGRISPDTIFPCTGTFWLKKTRFGCWNEYGHGEINLLTAVEQSCNIYFYQAACKIGGKLIVKWAKRFGFASKTGIDITEESGRLPRIYWEGDACNLAVGQGNLLVTPLQLARAFAAIANGGTLVTPHIMLKIADHEGKVIDTGISHCTPQRLNISPSTIKFIRKALRAVVVEGTVSNVAEAADLQKWGVAAKSGTAETGKEDVNHAWLAGFVPYDAPRTPLGRPRICFAIVAERVPGFGGETCAPILKKFLEYYFSTPPKVARR